MGYILFSENIILTVSLRKYPIVAASSETCLSIKMLTCS